MNNEKSILLIDSDTNFLTTTRHFLENWHFHVTTASSACEGLEKILSSKPDLIVMDIDMPTMSGHEICARLKAHEETRHIPIIILSSRNDTMDKVEALNLGAADYIYKGVSPEELHARIKVIIRETSPEGKDGIAYEKSKRILELRNILDRKELRTLYQPIVNLATRQTLGYESLVRGPQGSDLENPLTLFATASEADMYFELDKMCIYLTLERADFLSNQQILFINVNPDTLGNNDFQGMQFLHNTPLAPSQLCLELTERTGFENFTQLTANLERYRLKGMKAAIDDIGEGYSSLKAIAELKPEYMKIDMALIRGIDVDEVRVSIVSLLVDFARKVKSQLIGEGIETEAEYRTLMSLGIKYGQGYYFAKPQDASVFRTSQQ
ncbi:MAG: EAL domain-containing response regulator [Candidatus Omnitrophica bacterium]|nr:EAL domain-containing response regulator [Candidatus Omnitrophota bacterium]